MDLLTIVHEPNLPYLKDLKPGDFFVYEGVPLLKIIPCKDEHGYDVNAIVFVNGIVEFVFYEEEAQVIIPNKVSIEVWT